jgi:hypothetical protein
VGPHCAGAALTASCGGPSEDVEVEFAAGLCGKGGLMLSTR